MQQVARPARQAGSTAQSVETRVGRGSSPALLHEKLHVGRLFRIVEEVPPLMSAYAELICCIGHQLTDMLYLRAAKKRPVL